MKEYNLHELKYATVFYTEQDFIRLYGAIREHWHNLKDALEFLEQYNTARIEAEKDPNAQLKWRLSPGTKEASFHIHQGDRRAIPALSEEQIILNNIMQYIESIKILVPDE
jgi:hypothetical protein